MPELEVDGMAADLHSFAAAELASVTRRAAQTDATLDALDALIRLGEAAEAFDPKLDCHPARGARDPCRASGDQYPDLHRICRQPAGCAACIARARIEGEVLAISGLDTERERTRIAERFAEEDGIILVSTDSLAEGLNLQQRCLQPDPSRSAVQSEPARAAQRSYRSLWTGARPADPLPLSRRHVRGAAAAAPDRKVREGPRAACVHAGHARGDGE